MRARAPSLCAAIKVVRGSCLPSTLCCTWSQPMLLVPFHISTCGRRAFTLTSTAISRRISLCSGTHSSTGFRGKCTVTYLLSVPDFPASHSTASVSAPRLQVRPRVQVSGIIFEQCSAPPPALPPHPLSR